MLYVKEKGQNKYKHFQDLECCGRSKLC